MKRPLSAFCLTAFALSPLVLALGSACGQAAPPSEPPALAVATAPAATQAATDALDPRARELLQVLHDRRNTLREFTAKVDYMVTHPVTEEISGKSGTVDFLVDPAKGPIFTVNFKINIDKDGKPVRTYQQQIIFDGVFVTLLDYPAKEFIRSRELPEGASPGAAVTLNGPMTLPIGLNVEDVAKNFVVTVLPAKTDPNLAYLRLVPRTGSGAGKFEFRQLDITIDQKLELPIDLVQTAPGKNGDITNIHLTGIQVNTGKAKMQDPTPPAGWTERKPK